jgi:hypothetical protein
MRNPLLLRGMCVLLLMTFAAPGSAQSAAPTDTTGGDEGAPAIAATSPSPPSTPKPVLSVAPAAVPGAVELSLVTDDPRIGLYAKETRRLVLHDDVGESWEFICKAPCDARVDPHRIYRVMGDGVIPSKDFNLAPGSGKVALRVSPASHGTRVAASVIAGLGAAFIASSAVVLLFEVSARSAADAFGMIGTSDVTMSAAAAQSQLESTADTFEIVAVTFLAVGLVACVTALALALSSNTGLDPVGPSARARTGRPLGPRLIPGGFAF